MAPGIYIWCFLCFICFNGLESTKIYLVKYSDTGEIEFSNYIKNSNEKVNEYDQSEYLENDNTEQNTLLDHDKEKEGAENANTHTLVCDLFIDNKHQIRCTKNVNIKKRSAASEFDIFETLKKLAQPLYNIYSPSARQNASKNKFVDLTRLSQDSVDVEDLARSQRFSYDYIDIKDFRSGVGIPVCNSFGPDEFNDITSIKCLPLTRKTGLPIEYFDYPSFKARVFESDSDSSDSEEEKPKKPTRMKRKPKRFQVIKDDGEYDDDSDTDSEIDNNENNSDEIEKSSKDIDDTVKNYETESSEDDAQPTKSDQSGHVESETINIHNVPLNLDSEDTDSEESIEKPKKPKGKFKMALSANDDKYAYMQGNKYYNQYIKSYDDFRRGNRLPYFLPKRFRWRDEEIQRLGYLWFNGPKGKFIAAN